MKNADRESCKHENAHSDYEQCSLGFLVLPVVQRMAGHCFVCADCGARIRSGEVVGYIEEPEKK